MKSAPHLGQRPIVLLTNDDGVEAEGLRVLRSVISEWADVVVVAPATNQSATSHSLTLHRVLRLRSLSESRFSVDGTPADCVYVALNSGERILPGPVALCISGINHGPNLGVDVFYSGTVAAAREAALRGVPSLAVSADVRADLAAVAALASRLAHSHIAGATAGSGLLLNVNVPLDFNGRVEATQLGKRVYDSGVDFRRDPRGQEYLWIAGATATHHEAPGSDTDAYERGVASVTPLTLNLTEEGGMSWAEKVVASH